MRKSLIAALAVVSAIAMYMVWTSSPTVPLTLARQEAIDRAAVDATVDGRVAWTRLESKLVTYREWQGPFGLSGGLGYPDTRDPDTLYWAVAYLGPMTAMDSPSYRCQWVVRIFAADRRAPDPDDGADVCGQGGWRFEFALLPDRSWWRPGDWRF